MNETPVKITECPRDAMQGIAEFIPTHLKAAYINLLLQVGFDTIDFGSFVSAKVIPQLRDTSDVLDRLELQDSSSKLLAIIANHRGAEDAVSYPEITYLGYPFSISETFQLRNTNSTIIEAFDQVNKINDLCKAKNKKLRIYLSMGFGNPYGDEWNTEIVAYWAQKMFAIGVAQVALSDTIGVATPEQIRELFPALKQISGETEIGLHLHSTPDSWQEKIAAAYESGCTQFDTALKGYGGCPMAKDELTGNIATENLIAYLEHQNSFTGLNLDKLAEAMEYSNKVFKQN
ncbi:hydroxymethylglutaryl-CoA lyase [Mucilaginibacter segetis]|uniref:Hydroxymethylglutaryl-CoA lyase n=1 Tax=Mucilaginibacter segetis TaxID=2793071 RepID=A0A934UNJ3_9SPHI|nr:hydroxymethylglutaryl-CoA lyase [Mucilaginibacter segetis]MBK0380858.1 hydroxymethylglutaryl-CoA lyase [Mucilaginibacter segetis]